MSQYNFPDAKGHFGPYGGVFVAETLFGALDELKAAYVTAQADPAFRAEYEYELKHFVGRPSPIYHATRWAAVLESVMRKKAMTCTRTGTRPLS